jgi:hypothetical protein
MLSPTGGRGFASPQSRPQLGAKPQTGPTASTSRPSGQGGLGQMIAAQSSPGQTPLSMASAMTQPSGPIPRPSNFAYGAQQQTSSPVSAPSKSNALVLLLITILVAAIGVLAYLVFTK